MIYDYPHNHINKQRIYPEKSFYFNLGFLFIAFSLLSYLNTQASLQDEVSLFRSQIAKASPVLTTAFYAFAMNYNNNQGMVNLASGAPVVLDYTRVVSSAESVDNPIANIRYGFVHPNNIANSSSCSTPTRFCVAGADNIGQYVLEVVFKSSSGSGSTHDSGISVALDGKKVLFVATAIDGDLVYTGSSAADATEGWSAFASDSKRIASLHHLSGAVCRLKSAVSTESSSGSYPYMRASSAANTIFTINAGSYPGKVLFNNHALSLFTYTLDSDKYGLFANCSDIHSTFNDMGSTLVA